MENREIKVSTSRGRVQQIHGLVVSDRMNKTRVIVVKRQVRHDLYKKSLRRTRKFFVHDEKNQSQTGDMIEAVSTRRLSAKKHFVLSRIIQKRSET